MAFANTAPSLKKSEPLVFTKKESEVIRRYFPNLDVKFDEKATETSLLQAIDGADVLHIASHGEFSANAPAESKLLLSSDQTNDGNLSVADVFALAKKSGSGRPLDLVTLSACESGLGELVNGQEITSLNRAFMTAGAKSVVSALWRISDVASAVVMKRFYRYLSEGKSKAEALRLSQLSARKYFRHPAYWSSFKLAGAWQ